MQEFQAAHHIYSRPGKPRLAFLLKDDHYDIDSVKRFYIDPITHGSDIPLSDFVAVALAQQGRTILVREALSYIVSHVAELIATLNINYLIVTDATYVKVLTKLKRATEALAVFKPCVIEGLEHVSVMYCPSYRSSYFSSELSGQISLCTLQIRRLLQGKTLSIGSSNLNCNCLDANLEQIKQQLDAYSLSDKLTCDVETYSLDHYKAGLGVVGLAISQTEAICIPVMHTEQDPCYKSRHSAYVAEVLTLLRDFFEKYQGTLIFHNAIFDIKILTYILYMKDVLDYEGMHKGLAILCRNFDDTKLIAYTARNSCETISYSLKALSYEYMGNYGVDVKDITLISTKDLSTYCAKDCIATFYTYNKYYPQMLADNQLSVYTHFKDVVKSLIEIELVGLPVNLERAQEVNDILLNIKKTTSETLDNSALIKQYNTEIKGREDHQFKYASNHELRAFLYGFCKLTTKNKTATGSLSADAATLKALTKIADVPQDVVEVINLILELRLVDKLLSTYMSHLVNAHPAPDGWHYIYGSFNLGSTKTGRLSSSNPNLQNIPTKSDLAKLIKSCFQANHGHALINITKLRKYAVTLSDRLQIIECLKLSERRFDEATGTIMAFVSPYNIAEFKNKCQAISCLSDLIAKGIFKIDAGEILLSIDFSALEDRINALITKDKNKLKVYLGSKQYEVKTQDGQTIVIKEGDTINYLNEYYTFETFLTAFAHKIQEVI